VKQDLVAGIPVDFALNSLVVLAMGKGPVNEIADLARPGVKVVLANDVVPVGSYSIQVLKNLSQDPIYGLGIGFKDRVLANRVSGEPNVGNLFQKVVLGEVDAGIVYETDTARSLDARTKDIFFISIPDAANVSARYPIAVLEDAPEPELAQQFVQFVLSNAGQTLLHGYGFSSP
jgi:molybdate transport system substrate-binding protein